MKLTQTSRHYDLNDGTKAILRVIEPSKPLGGWPGNSYVIRSWEVTQLSSSIYRKCTDQEIERLEAELGEVDNFQIVPHPTLVRVAVPTHPEPEKS